MKARSLVQVAWLNLRALPGAALAMLPILLRRPTGARGRKPREEGAGAPLPDAEAGRRATSS
ncbi:hypothetical protein AnaeK_3593 [Anaeromyxobacter sp. K]|uniref:Uncharacterized protein n=1 Tax=Anaeromyxobacter dehalogenans (strain ATCC BAA-258 / DSM 21875 / 2CP-1) TaxID=455488 RepID=B8J6L7_ANAD2|nr:MULTISPECIES: hypothetical protein [Anaeromyxobacter]ACG74806.1 hypothetical protein AnaeK_3593 [Anaeromyxobacter sp. K]ACL66989.1 conserved hypothetical protein [Anaeromyxobacter dehalogenans 2CP-1]